MLGCLIGLCVNRKTSCWLWRSVYVCVRACVCLNSAATGSYKSLLQTIISPQDGGATDSLQKLHWLVIVIAIVNKLFT